MLLREAIDNAGNFFHKTLRNVKYFVIREYQKLHKASTLTPFCCSKNSSFKIHELDQYYAEISPQGDSDQERPNKEKRGLMTLDELMKQEDACIGSLTEMESRPLVKSKSRERRNKQKRMGACCKEGKKGEPSSRKPSIGGDVLAQKMKELEKMEGGDVEHSLDVEEVLHYYSRLKSPIYLDIVDKFFTEVYSELVHPQASVNARRRLGPVKL